MLKNTLTICIYKFNLCIFDYAIKQTTKNIHKMETFLTTVQEQIKSKTAWMSLGSMLYVIDYSRFVSGLETEEEAENNAFVYWETTKGIQFQDERSKTAYINNISVLAQK